MYPHTIEGGLPPGPRSQQSLEHVCVLTCQWQPGMIGDVNPLNWSVKIVRLIGTPHLLFFHACGYSFYVNFILWSFTFAQPAGKIFSMAEYGSLWSWKCRERMLSHRSIQPECQSSDFTAKSVDRRVTVVDGWGSLAEQKSKRGADRSLSSTSKVPTVLNSHFQKSLDVPICLWYFQNLTNSIKPHTVYKYHWRSEKTFRMYF